MEKKRFYGIDLARILSMFMVVILHILGQGGILKVLSPDRPAAYFAAWWLEAASFGAVNCFAMISGFVGVNGKHKPSRLIGLWLQTVFYTLVITLCFFVFRPSLVAWKEWRCALFPVTAKQYWYVTAYFLLFLLMPMLNAGMRKITRRSSAILLAALTVGVVLLPYLLGTDPYKLGGDYSPLWLIVLYPFGAHFRRFGFPKALDGKGRSLCIFLLCAAATVAGKAIPAIPSLYNYHSPTVLIGSVALFSFFVHTDPRGKISKPLISFFAPTALAVYIIHSHPLLWKYCWKGRTALFAADSAPLMILKVLGLAAAVFLVCAVIERIRMRLFRLLRIDSLIKKADNTGEEQIH